MSPNNLRWVVSAIGEVMMDWWVLKMSPKRVCFSGHITSAGDPQVCNRYLLKIPTGCAPVNPDHIIPTGHARSRYQFWIFADTCRYLQVLAVLHRYRLLKYYFKKFLHFTSIYYNFY